MATATAYFVHTVRPFTVSLLESTAYGRAGGVNSVADSTCSSVTATAASGELNDCASGDVEPPLPLDFAYQDMAMVISNTAHAELQYHTQPDEPAR